MIKSLKFVLTAVVGLSLLTPVGVRAIPPRQHSVSVAILRIDSTARIIVVSHGEQGTSSAFVWNDTTGFYADGVRVSAEEIMIGETVRLTFRREAGRKVIRRLSIERTPNGCCVGGRCHSAREENSSP